MVFVNSFYIGVSFSANIIA